MTYRDILKRYWGYDDFRGIQRDIIESIGSGHDTLGLMPTGGGKSITFQVPALAIEGTCIVITPLIALMKDQVQALRRRGIRASAIYSGMSHDDILRTLENAIFGAVKLLYVSPERLTSELFQQKVSHMKVSFICVDEAHCICQWGYDFRPSYLCIAKIRKLLPLCPVLALTATATPEVVDDIQDKLRKPADNGTLEVANFQVFRMSFERQNLAYLVREVSDKENQLVHILQTTEGSAIVYARSRQRTKEIAQLLRSAGLSATFFHAGLDHIEKDLRQRDWQEDRIRIMVATNAFGMGIDKPDVRVVLHIDCPDSIEAYFQEAGRAGRDGQKAQAIMLYNGNDHRKLMKRISDTFPERDFICNVYDHLAYFYQIAVGSGYNAMFEFPVEKFCNNYGYFSIQVESALKILDRAGYIEYKEEQENQARLRFSLERDDLYRLHDNSANEDAVIVALLRNYSGLFNDYQYIDEPFLAQQLGLKLTELYTTLINLNRKHILSFIPQKRTPYIRYRQRREESKFLEFPPHVYEDLKKRYAERISQMLNYVTTTNQCRSSMLLKYFGEESRKDCGQCDVCMDRSSQSVTSSDETDEARKLILNLLADGKPHYIAGLHNLSLPYDAIDAALQALVNEEAIIDDDGFLSINNA